MVVSVAAAVLVVVAAAVVVVIVVVVVVLQVSCLFMLLYVHRSDIGLIGDGRRGGGAGGTYECLVLALRSAKTEETVSHRENNVKEMGTPSVPSSFCTPELALLTAVRNRVTKTEVRRQTPSTGLRHPSFSHCRI